MSFRSRSLTFVACAAVFGACTPEVDTSETLIDDSYQPAKEGVMYSISGTQLDALGKGGRITMQTLQGVLNKETPRVFISIDSGEAHDSDWLDVLVRQHGAEVEANQDYLWYLWAFNDHFDGYILFNNLSRESANVAVSLAGVLNAVAIDSLDQEGHKMVDKELGMTQLLNVSDWTESDLISSEYWALFSDGVVMQEPFSGPEMAPRDFGVSRSLAFFWDDQRDDPALLLTNAFFDHVSSGIPVFGWSYSDYEDNGAESFVSIASASGLPVVGTNAANNLSVYAHFPDTTFDAHIPEEVEIFATKYVHTIAFVMSDGEQVGSLMGRATNAHNGFFTASDSYPVGWTVSPQLQTLASPIHKWMHDNASDDDVFLGAASGGSLLYPSLWPDNAAWAESTAASMASMGHSITTVVDYADGFSTDVLGALLEQSGVDAVLFSAVQSSDFDTRDILWHNDKPIIPMRRLGFSETRTADEITDWVADFLGSGIILNTASAQAYTLVYVNLANSRLSDFQAIEDALVSTKSAAFQVVRPDTLVSMVVDLVEQTSSETGTKTGE